MQDRVDQTAEEAPGSEAEKDGRPTDNQLEEFSELGPEEKLITVEAARSLDRSLYITRHVKRTFERHDFEGQEPSEEEINWVLTQLARFEASSPFHPKSAGELHALEAHREQQAFLLLEVKGAFRDNELRDALEKEAAEAHKRGEGSTAYLLEIAGRVRGYFFERLSAKVPLADENLASLYPRGLEEKEEEEFAQRLGGYQLRVVPLSPRWQFGNVVGELVFQEVVESEGYRSLQAQLQKEKKGLYVHSPLRDPKGERLKKALEDKNTLVLRFDRAEVRWSIAGDKELLARFKDKVRNLETQAQERNQLYHQAGGRPDNVIASAAGTEGLVETKCWPEEEMQAFVAHLEDQDEEDLDEEKRSGGKMGGFFPEKKLNTYRQILGGEPLTYPAKRVRRGLDLTLNLPAEVRFTSIAANKPEAEIVAVVRVPGDLSDSVLERLQEQLKRRNLGVVLQRLNLINSSEVEELALSHIRSPEFAQSLAEKWQTELNSSEKEKNLRARSLALGVKKLEDLEAETVPAEYDTRDIVAYSLGRQLGEEVKELLGEEKTRGEKLAEQLTLLKKHHQTFKEESQK